MIKKLKPVSINEWEALLKEERDMFYVSTDLELLVRNNRFGFTKDIAEKIFNQAVEGFHSMLLDPNLPDSERDAVIASLRNLKIVPLRYH